MVTIQNHITESDIYNWLAAVTDPEIPVLSILDLGIVRKVNIDEQNHIEIIITPTYSGCPAMEMINVLIRTELAAHSCNNVAITQQLEPAWTTDWLTEEGHKKLLEYGIAPPVNNSHQQQRINDILFGKDEPVPCPLCGAANTSLLSQFGSTSCKALYRCNECLEPFDHFKCH